MKSLQHIENEIRNLAQEQSAVPPPMVWDNIQRTLHPNRKRKFVWFFASLVTLSLVTLIAVNYFEKNNPIENAVIVLGQDENDNSNQINAKGEIPGLEGKPKEIFPKEIVNQETAINSFSTQTKDVISQKELTKKSTTTSLIDETKNKQIISENESNSIPESSIDFLNKNVVSIESNLKDESNVFAVEKQEIQKLASLDKIVIDQNDLTFNRKRFLINDDVKCPSFGNKKGLRPFVEINGILGKHAKSISPFSTDGENPFATLEAKRNETESSWYTWGANALVGINLTSNLYAGVGIDWSESKDKFADRSETLAQLIVNFDPATGEAIDSTIVLGKIESTGEVRYRMLDIPLVIGYTHSVSSWNFGLELGALYNLKFSAEGKIVAEDLSISRIENESPIYKSKMGFGAKAALVVSKQIGNGVSIHMKPTYKKYFTDANADGYPLPMKFNFMRIDIGARMDF